MKKIIFLCTGNSCRSQMSEGFAKHFFSQEESLIQSAGIRADGLNKTAVKVMKETDIDITTQTSKTIASITLKQFDLIVTVCDYAQGCVRNTSHSLNYSKIFHKSVFDPVMIEGTDDYTLIGYRKIRNQIKEMIIEIINTYELICKNG